MRAAQKKKAGRARARAALRTARPAPATATATGAALAAERPRRGTGCSAREEGSASKRHWTGSRQEKRRQRRKLGRRCLDRSQVATRLLDVQWQWRPAPVACLSLQWLLSLLLQAAQTCLSVSLSALRSATAGLQLTLNSHWMAFSLQRLCSWNILLFTRFTQPTHCFGRQRSQTNTLRSSKGCHSNWGTITRYV